MTIKTKSFNYGDKKEASWPPKFPKKAKGVLGYWDKEKQKFVEGRPPNPNNQFGIAPIAIFDSMPPTYHEAACQMVESRKEWDRLDRETNSLTFSNVKESRSHVEKGSKEKARELRKDRRRASEEAIKMVRANPKHINQKLQKEAEKQRKTAKQIANNYDLHNELKDIL